LAKTEQYVWAIQDWQTGKKTDDTSRYVRLEGDRMLRLMPRKKTVQETQGKQLHVGWRN